MAAPGVMARAGLWSVLAFALNLAWEIAQVRLYTLWAEADGTITVAFMDPEAVLRLVDKPEVHALGKEVRVLLQRVCASLKA